MFGGKSVKQIRDMINENDLDVELLREKKRLKMESQLKKKKQSNRD